MPRLLRRCGVECYVTGNFSRAETQQLGEHVERILKVCPVLCCALLSWLEERSQGHGCVTSEQQPMTQSTKEPYYSAAMVTSHVPKSR